MAEDKLKLGGGKTLEGEVRVPTTQEFENLKAMLADRSKHEGLNLGVINCFTHEQRSELLTAYAKAFEKDKDMSTVAIHEGFGKLFENVNIVHDDIGKFIAGRLRAYQNSPDLKSHFQMQLTSDVYYTPDQVRAMQQAGGINDTELVTLNVNITQGITGTFTSQEVEDFLKKTQAIGISTQQTADKIALSLKEYFIDSGHQFTQAQVAMLQEHFPAIQEAWVDTIKVAEDSPRMEKIIQEEHTVDDILQLEFKKAYGEIIAPMYKNDLQGLDRKQKLALRREMFKLLAGSVYEQEALSDLNPKDMKKLCVRAMKNMGVEISTRLLEETGQEVVSTAPPTASAKPQEETAESLRSIGKDAAQMLKNIASTAVNPWRLTDATQGFLAKLRARPTMFGTIMDGLFDPDNGVLMQGELGKMLDSFSFHKTFERLDKWEQSKTARMRTEAYAKSRAYYFANALGDNMDDLRGAAAITDTLQLHAFSERDCMISLLSGASDQATRAVVSGVDLSVLQSNKPEDRLRIDDVQARMQANLDGMQGLDTQERSAMQQRIDTLFQSTRDNLYLHDEGTELSSRMCGLGINQTAEDTDENAPMESIGDVPRQEGRQKSKYLYGYLQPDGWAREYTDALSRGDATGALNFIKNHARRNGRNGCLLMLSKQEMQAIAGSVTGPQLDEFIKYIGKYHGRGHSTVEMLEAVGDRLTDRQKQKLFDKVYAEGNRYNIEAFERIAPGSKPSIFGRMQRVHKDALRQAAYGSELGSRSVLEKIKGAANYVRNMGAAIIGSEQTDQSAKEPTQPAQRPSDPVLEP